ncbi:MAG TPA: hypothetical protein VM661_10325 [Candidatus Sulfotelmatobacter sp.]|jgi:hypothetical protein|nr:hypothetical protein [Candidatus Sulfotelmatobacter sp.]
MSGDLVIESGPKAYGLDALAPQTLSLDAEVVSQIKEDAQPALDRFLADEDNAAQPHGFVTRFTDDPAGRPYVVQPDFEAQGKGPFVPMLRDGRTVTVELVAPVEGVKTVTVTAKRGAATPDSVYPGQPIDRLGQDGYALAIEPDSQLIKDIAQSFGHIFAARIDTLHQAMRAFGLPAPDLQYDPVRFHEATPRGFKFSLVNAADGKEVAVEIIRNGSIFMGGRRYDANLSRLALSDAEISNTGIFRIDVDHVEHSAEITFMTFDAKPAFISLHPSRPLAPQFEGNIPDSALTVLNARTEAATLGGLARSALKRIETSGKLGGFFAKLFNGETRQAHADLAALTSYLAGDISAKAEIQGWKSRPQDLSRVAEILMRWLPANRQGLGLSQVSALVSIGVGKFLAEKLG